ncbi:MAG: AAA family ATPase [Tissierellia bacterium]|nr:AAA family ATPase [Tissierellia bacterium]
MIEKVELEAVGPFERNVITFHEGYNEIQAPNEWGKSTLLWTIFVILYGLSKDSLHRVLPSELYDRLKPVGQSRFQGALTLVQDGVGYRIHRVFLKGSEEVLVERLDTGRSFEDPSFTRYSRVPQPGVYFFGLTRRQFEEFFLHMEAQDPREVFEEAQNFLHTGSTQYSLEGAMARVEERLREIGTEGRKTSQLGRISLSLKEKYQLLARERPKIQGYGAAKTSYEGLRAQREKLLAQREEAPELPEPKDLRELIGEVQKKDGELAMSDELIQKLEQRAQGRRYTSSWALLGWLLLSLLGLGAGLFFAVEGAQVQLILLPISISAVGGGFFFTRLLGRVFGKRALARYHRAFQERDELYRQKEVLRQRGEALLKRPLSMEALHSSLLQFQGLVEGGYVDREEMRRSEELRKGEYDLGRAQALLHQMEDSRAQVVALEEEIQREEDQREKLRQEQKILQDVRGIFEELKLSEGAQVEAQLLRESFNYFRRATGGEDSPYHRLGYDEAQGFYVDREGSILRLMQLSRSTQELMAICLKLAMMDLVGRGEIPALMDDPLAYFDSQRKEEVKELLAEAGRQIILLETT